jgi:hypothetical protein
VPSVCASFTNAGRGEVSWPGRGRSAVEVEVVTGREEGSVEGIDGVTRVCRDRVSAMLPSHRLLAPSSDCFLASNDSLSCPSRASRQSTRQSPAT